MKRFTTVPEVGDKVRIIEFGGMVDAFPVGEEGTVEFVPEVGEGFITVRLDKPRPKRPTLWLCDLHELGSPVR